MKKRTATIKMFRSYEDANDEALREAFAMTPEARLEAVNTIRRELYAMKGIIADNKVKRVISYDKR